MPGATLEEAFQEFHPDIFIMDAHIDTFVADDLSDPSTSLGTYSEYLRMPRPELERILTLHGSLVDKFDGGPYGQIRIYKFRWN